MGECKKKIGCQMYDKDSCVGLRQCYEPIAEEKVLSAKMAIDFNHVRERLCIDYNRLVRKLNESRVHGKYIELACYEIDDLMVDIRQYIATIAMTFEEGREDFKDVLGDYEIEIFNQEDE